MSFNPYSGVRLRSELYFCGFVAQTHALPVIVSLYQTSMAHELALETKNTTPHRASRLTVDNSILMQNLHIEFFEKNCYHV